MTRSVLNRTIILVACLCTIPQTLIAQPAAPDEVRTFGGMTLAYSRSANDLPTGRRPYTLQPSVNNALGLMQVDAGLRYRSHGLQATLALQLGWFADANYTGKDYDYRNLQQAWLQYDITAEVSLRAGVMPSHIGYESINERENLIVSRLFCSDATPYYETGGSLQWRHSEKLSIEGLVLNGWQNIVPINDDPVWGTRVVWKPDTMLTVNWSAFYGNTSDQALPASMRFYNNVWVQCSPFDELTLVGIADIGHQMITTDSAASMWCVAAMAAYRPHPQWRTALRAEYYSDPRSIIVRAIDGSGFVASSLSANVDWMATASTRVRAEIRRMGSPQSIFMKSDGLTASEVYATISASTSF